MTQVAGTGGEVAPVSTTPSHEVSISLTLLLATLRDLQEMAIGVAEEGPDLVAPIDGWGEELCPAGAQHLVGSQAASVV
jgi:hypothetical protein